MDRLLKIAAPWTVAVLALAYALFAGSAPSPPASAPSNDSSTARAEALRRDLSALEAENAALRRELDRLRTQPAADAAVTDRPSSEPLEEVAPEVPPVVNIDAPDAPAAVEQAVASAAPEPESCDQIAERAAGEMEIEQAQSPTEGRGGGR